MAGFVDRKFDIKKNQTQTGFISRMLKDLSRLGMKYDDLAIKNSRALGVQEKFRKTANTTINNDEDIWNAFVSMSMADSTLKDNVAVFDIGYEQKRVQLRKFSLNDEIEEILDVLCDECIVYPPDNFACSAIYNLENVKQTLRDEINTNFKSLYYYFGFADGHTLWDYFRKWLIDGYLAFEIVYDDKQRHIIGFKELDPLTLKPSIITDDSGKMKKVYIQYKGQGFKETVLYDSQVIYISFSQKMSTSRVSYIERLIRAFNLLRIMETTRITWAVTNSSYRTKFVIPVGGKSKTRAKQSLAQLMSNYREDIVFNNDSGELTINGKPMMPFNREYWLPSKDGESPEIENLGGDGPEISDTDALKYFVYKLRDASRIPYNRFDKENSAGYELAAEGMMRDEIRFSKFINRLRSKFSAILLKPLYIQLILNHPELANDESFKLNLAIQYNKENVFEELKEYELIQRRIELISALKDALVTQDADMNDIQFFDINFLVERVLVDKYFKITLDDLKMNAEYKAITKIEKEGYSREDALRIFGGEKRSKFKRTPSAAESESENMGDQEIESGNIPGEEVPEE